MLRLLAIFFCALTICSCTEKKIVEDFNKNIVNHDKFSNFEEQRKEIEHAALDKHIEEMCHKSSLNVKNLPLYTLASLLDTMYDMNIQSETVDIYDSMQISVNMRDVCLSHILDYLTKAYNIGHTQSSFGYSLYPPALRTKIFTVDYHTFQRSASSAISINSGQLNDNQFNSITKKNSYSVVETKTQEAFWDSIERTLLALIADNDAPVYAASSTSTTTDTNNNKTTTTNNIANSSGLSVSVSRENGLVIVRAYPRGLKLVEDFISKVNKNSLKQVVIEARILEVALNDEFQQGIKWEALKRKFYISSIGTDFSKRLPNPKAFNSTEISSDAPITSMISAEITNCTDFDSIIQMLSSQGKISVLSSPMVSTLNNQRAIMKYGEDQYFVTNVTGLQLMNTQTTTGVVPVQSSGFTMAPFFSGIALDTTPNIIGDNEVILHIRPIISRVTQTNISVQINGQNNQIPSASVQSREADTILKARSGDIVILGGLTEDMVNLSSSGAPFREGSILSKLFAPFSAKKHSSKKTELIILLKPTIVSSGRANISSRLKNLTIDE